jgi:hypothetical protein
MDEKAANLEPQVRACLLDEIDELVRRILSGKVRRSRTPDQPKQTMEAGNET